MPKIPHSRKKPALARKNKKTASDGVRNHRSSSSRRQFIKLAGVVTAATVITPKSSGMTLTGSKFSKEWLEMVRLTDYDLSSSGCSCEGSSGDTGFSVQQQEQLNWCWIAVAVSVQDFLPSSTSYSQCDLYNELHTGLECCEMADDSLSLDDPCDQQGVLCDALTAAGNHCADVEGPTDFSDIQDQIDNGLPVALRVESGGEGHFVVISAYECDDGNPVIWIEDPQDGSSNCYDFCYFECEYGATWTDTIYLQ